MTHVKTALGLLLLSSIAVYFPQTVPMFYSSKARNQENQYLTPQFSALCYLNSVEEIVGGVLATLQSLQFSVI